MLSRSFSQARRPLRRAIQQPASRAAAVCPLSRRNRISAFSALRPKAVQPPAASSGRFAPTTVIRRSPASGPNRTFRQARLVTGTGGFLPVCLRAGCVDIGLGAQHQGWPKSANLLSVRTSPPSLEPSQSAGDGHHCDALVVSLRVPSLIETTKVADDRLSRLGISQSGIHHLGVGHD
jgi:hypothetical protein